MKKDHIFKKSVFGGFKREDVLTYIDEIKQETVNEKEKNKSLCEKCDTLNSTIDGLENEVCQANGRESKLINDLSEKNDEIIALSKRIAELEGKIEELEQNSEKYKAVESQVGSMIVDARCYSDKVIENAKDKVNEISAEYCEVANDISEEIDSVSVELHDVSDKVSGVINTVVDKLSKLTQHLKSAEKLLLKSNKSYEENVDEIKKDTYVTPQIEQPKQVELNEQGETTPNVFKFHQLSDDEFNDFTNEYEFEESVSVEPHFSVNVAEISDDINSFPAVSYASSGVYSGMSSSYNGFIN